MHFILLLMVAMCQAIPRFYRLYDLAQNNSDMQVTDLITLEDHMQGGNYNGYGIDFKEGEYWWNNNNKSQITFGLDKDKGLAIVAVFKPRSLNKEMTIIDIKYKDDSKCGLKAVNDSFWQMYCDGPSGKEDLMIKGIRAGELINFGLAFSLVGDNKTAELSFLRYILDSLIPDSELDPPLTLKSEETFTEKELIAVEFNSTIAASLYYFGVFNEAIGEHEFSKFVSSTDVRTKDITCYNCAGNSSLLNCPKSHIIPSPYTMREYFCSCENNAGFVIKERQCMSVTSVCDLKCEFGCMKANRRACLYECPSGTVVNDSFGDFFSCVCTDNSLCEEMYTELENPKSEPLIPDSVLYILVALLVIFLIVVIYICLTSVNFSEYCRKKEQEEFIEPQGIPSYPEKYLAQSASPLASQVLNNVEKRSFNIIRRNHLFGLKELNSSDEILQLGTVPCCLHGHGQMSCKPNSSVITLKGKGSSRYPAALRQNCHEELKEEKAIVTTELNEPWTENSDRSKTCAEAKPIGLAKETQKAEEFKDRSCFICVYDFDGAEHRRMLVLPCGHEFCEYCVRRFDACPIDRIQITEKKFVN